MTTPVAVTPQLKENPNDKKNVFEKFSDKTRRG
jgi:hypothetical protein